MRLNWIGVVFVLLHCYGCLSLNIVGNTTVSGLSSGGYMAVQYHFAHSSSISGVAIVAGGPRGGALNSEVIAQTACTTKPNLLFVEPLVAETRFASKFADIDDVSSLRNQTVMIVHGKSDPTVLRGVVDKLHTFYAHFVARKNIILDVDDDFGHGWPTDSFGVPCTETATPFINACGIDLAERIVNAIIVPKTKIAAPRVERMVESSLVRIPQIVHLEEVDDSSSSSFSREYCGLQNEAFAYIPEYCERGGECGLHVSFHGCRQTIDQINDTFVTKVGLNEWSESNHFVVLYPQAKMNDQNTRGCWDFFGYSNRNYLSRKSPQIAVVHKMIDYLKNEY